MSTTQAKAISGQELLERLAQLAEIGLTTVDRWIINEAREQRPMAEAQRLLEQHGYYLSEWAMVERAFYQLTYSPRWDAYPYADRWPYPVELRYITTGITGSPPLVLSYYEDGVLTPYKGLSHYIYGSKSSDAEKMLYHFRGEHPDKEPKWLPVFDGHWPVVHKR